MLPPHQKSRRSRYRVIDGKPAIELKLREPRQLFDERDPAPFRERDLDDDAARYILSSFHDINESKDARISLQFETLGELREKPKVIEDAIRAFFRFESEMKRRELRNIFRTGLISLCIGLTFLLTWLYFSYIWADQPKTFGSSMLYEGLHLMGWVSMWKPIQIFLYDWWPIQGELNTYKALANVEIVVGIQSEEAEVVAPRKEAADEAIAMRSLQNWKTPSAV